MLLHYLSISNFQIGFLKLEIESSVLWTVLKYVQSFLFAYNFETQHINDSRVYEKK